MEVTPWHGGYMPRGSGKAVAKASPVVRTAWDRQPKESQPAFAAFELYRGMQPQERSYRRVCELLERPKGYARHLQRWGARFTWTPRIQAWDSHLARLRTADLESAHRIDLDELRGRLIRLHNQSLDVAQQVLEMAQDVLDAAVEVDPDTGERRVVIPLAKVPTFMRAASAVANTSIEGAAAVLGIDEILDGEG